MFLYILSWLATAIQILFLTIALASALYYMAELVEEYTVITENIIKYVLGAITLIYIGLFIFEDFSWLTIATGLVSNGIFALLLKDFPYISLTSPLFILSIVLVFINHFLAFKHFSEVFYPFSEVLAYFTICLWILPFAFFVSLSANENVLPTASTMKGSETDYTYVGQPSSKRSGILSVFDYVYMQIKNTWSPNSAKSF